MVSIVWKQSYEISCLKASLQALFSRIFDIKSVLIDVQIILSYNRRQKVRAAVMKSGIALAFDAISCGFRALGFRLVAANYCLVGAYYRLVGANYGLAAANETMARI